MNIVFLVLLIAIMIGQNKLNQEKKMKPIWEYLIVGLIFTLIIFGFGYVSKLFNCGFHFVDDHEFYTMPKNLEKMGLWNSLLYYLRQDLAFRFRPSYWILKVISVWFIGSNAFVWHIYMTVFSVISMTISYIFAREMKCPIWLSFLFPTLIFGGQQMAVLWRLGTQENYGIGLAMIVLLLTKKYIDTNRKGPFVWMTIVTIIMSGMKESFILLIPILPIWSIYYNFYYKSGKEISLLEIWNYLKKRKLYFITTYIIFFAVILVILLGPGAGMSSNAREGSSSLFDYLWITYSYYLKNYTIMCACGLVSILIPMIFIIGKKKDGKMNLLFKLFFPCTILLYIVCSQLYLFRGTAMYERYLIPTTLGYAMFWIIDIYNIVKNEARLKPVYTVFALVFGFIFITRLTNSYDLTEHVQEGYEINAMMDNVARCTKSDTVIIVSCEYEHDYAASIFLEEKYGIESVYNLNFAEHPNPEVAIDGYGINENETVSIYNADIYFGYDTKMQELKEKYGITFDDYNNYDYGVYELYIKRDIDINE